MRVQCPYCGSFLTERVRGAGEWIWLIAAAASFFLRFLMSLARYGEYRGEPGRYQCGNCGRTFVYFL